MYLTSPDYAPPSAIVALIIFGAALIAFGGALYVRPSIAWTAARWRGWSKESLEDQRRQRGDRNVKVLAIVIIVGGLVVIGIAIKSALT